MCPSRLAGFRFSRAVFLLSWASTAVTNVRPGRLGYLTDELFYKCTQNAMFFERQCCCQL